MRHAQPHFGSHPDAKPALSGPAGPAEDEAEPELEPDVAAELPEAPPPSLALVATGAVATGAVGVGVGVGVGVVGDGAACWVVTVWMTTVGLVLPSRRRAA